MKTLALFAILLAGSFCLAQEPQVTEPQEEIRAVLNAQVAAWNKGDMEGYMATYWHSTDVTFFSEGGITRGWQLALNSYLQRYKGKGQQMGKLSFGQLHIDVLSPDSAWVRGRWNLVMKSEKQPHGVFTLILKKFPEGWRIIHDHSSAVTN